MVALLSSLRHADCAARNIQGRPDAPPGLDASAPAEFQVLLLGFEREGYWQNLSWGQRWALAERLKAKGNALFKEKKFAYASNRCADTVSRMKERRWVECLLYVRAAAVVGLMDSLTPGLVRGTHGVRACAHCSLRHPTPRCFACTPACCQVHAPAAPDRVHARF